MSSDDLTDDILARAARRAMSGSAPLVAGLVEAWRKGFPDEEPTATLACTPRTLSELSLCLRPRGEQWLEDATEIAEAVALDPDRLIGFLRAAEAVERFGDAHPTDNVQAGRLLAARDRDEEDE